MFCLLVVLPMIRREMGTHALGGQIKIQDEAPLRPSLDRVGRG